MISLLAGAFVFGGAGAIEAAPAVAPSNNSSPTISGKAEQGSTLSASSGSWSGTTPMTFTYQWLRCDSAGANCTDINNADDPTYTLTGSDVGRRIRVEVTATNADGSAEATSDATDVIKAGDAPKNDKDPKISGDEEVGKTLTADRGKWEGTEPISYSYQWFRCNLSGGACVAIAGATSSTYRLATADSGHRIRVRVTASNSVGSTAELSDATKRIRGLPFLEKQPEIKGTPRVGETLEATGGQWDSPSRITAVTFQWYRCDAAGRNCAPVSGAVGRTYRLSSSDQGRRLIVYVKVENQVGATVATSAPTQQIAPGSGPTPPAVPPAPGAIAIADVALPNRLVITGVRFSPRAIRSAGQQIVAQFRVTDSAGRPVAGALVYAVAIPFNRLTAGQQVRTDASGWATLPYRVLPTFPIRPGFLVTMFVRAHKPGASLLGGVSTRRLVSIPVAR